MGLRRNFRSSFWRLLIIPGVWDRESLLSAGSLSLIDCFLVSMNDHKFSNNQNALPDRSYPRINTNAQDREINLLEQIRYTKVNEENPPRIRRIQSFAQLKEELPESGS